MKKQDIINLVKYHTEKNEEAFVSQVADIAREFDRVGDVAVAQYLMELISDANMYVPQSNYNNLHFLEKREYSSNSLFLPDVIEEDIIGVVRAIQGKTGMSKFLFGGAPGTGKTESAYQIARLLNRDILMVNLEELIDSKLGESSKNIARLFNEIEHLMYERVVVIFDELDALVLDRVGSNDLREMGRVTSTFLRKLDTINSQVVIIATTNLLDKLDKAVIRRFDAVVSFDRYSKDDLIKISDSILSLCLKENARTGQDIRLFNKILVNCENLPYPGDMKRIIKTSIAFSDQSNKFDYMRKIFLNLNNRDAIPGIEELQEGGYTTREIEVLSGVPKSSVARKLKEKTVNE